MPELPEVETVRRGLAPVLTGRVVTRLVQRRADLRRPFPKALAATVEGRRVLSVDRRAKYLLIRLEGGIVLIVHLGMTGRLFVKPKGHVENKHDHIEIALDNGKTIIFNDARRFGHLDLATEEALARYPGLAHLGPEPLDDAFTAKVLRAALGRRRTSFKAALMDQRTVAGLGNIYVCEALFAARIDPARLACTITQAEAGRLTRAIKAVLKAAIASGGSTLRDYVNAAGAAGYFQHAFAVYGRAGEPCPHNAAHTIQRMAQGGRSTFYCPRCQR